MGAIEFWYEFGSTYSYPAVMRIEKLAAQAGVEVRWRPFLLGPIFQTLGWNDSPFNIFAAKNRYMWRDLTRICEADGLRSRERVGALRGDAGRCHGARDLFQHCAGFSARDAALSCLIRQSAPARSRVA